MHLCFSLHIATLQSITLSRSCSVKSYLENLALDHLEFWESGRGIQSFIDMVKCLLEVPQIIIVLSKVGLSPQQCGRWLQLPLIALYSV